MAEAPEHSVVLVPGLGIHSVVDGEFMLRGLLDVLKLTDFPLPHSLHRSSQLLQVPSPPPGRVWDPGQSQVWSLSPCPGGLALLLLLLLPGGRGWHGRVFLRRPGV